MIGSLMNNTIDRLRGACQNLKINSIIKKQKNVNINGPNILSRDKNLKPYVPKLKEVGGNHHRLCFEYLDKGDIEHQFARLIATRQNELFQAAVLIIGFSYPMAAIPIMRAFSDTLFLLKYVESNPKYIIRFMGKAGGGIRIDQIKNEINDIALINYYSELSNLMHANPVSIKYTYQKVGNMSFLAFWPLNTEKLNEWHVINLIRLMEESNRIITDLYSKNWKPEKDRPKK